MPEDILSKIKSTRERLQNHAIAKKILDLMERLRMESNEFSERRWIWELLQNAQDVASQDKMLAISIEYNEEKQCLLFEHSGKAFSIDNIVGLIEQIGTKERNKIEGAENKIIGKFGTGFLTTHLLSEIVEVSSYLEEPQNQFRKFTLKLDRSGRDLDEIIAAVNNSIKVLEDFSQQPITTTNLTARFNTKFSYLLQSDSLLIAEKGMEDFIISIPFTLAFSNKINKVQIKSKKLDFEKGKINQINDTIKKVTIIKSTDDKTKELKILIASKNNTDIALAFKTVEGKNIITDFGEEIPRVFCEFPLIGTENFGFPVIINSSLFNPTEQRNGIFLTDKSEDKINENKAILITAVELYSNLLDYIDNSAKWENTYLLANFDKPAESNLISSNWFANFITKPVQEKVLKTKIVNTENIGITSIKMQDGSTVDFPFGSDSKIVDDLYDICSFSKYFILPLKSEIHEWNKIKWLKDYHITVKTIISLISENKDIESIAAKFEITNEESYTWLNNFIKFLVSNEFDHLISSNAILPNQSNVFKLKDSLYKESQTISEELKNLAFELGYDVRNELICKEIEIEFLENKTRTPSFVAHEIERLLKPKLKDIPRSDNTKLISKKLLLWFNNNKDEAESIFTDLYKNRHLLRDDDEIIKDMEKAELLEQIIDKSGVTQEEFEEIIFKDGKIIIKVVGDLYPESEDEIEQSYKLADHSDERSRITISEEAQELILNELKVKGFSIPENMKINYTIISGICKPDGSSVKIVVKSGKAGKLYFNPNEWLALSEDNSQLFVVTRGNVVRNVTITDLEEINDIFHMRFGTKAFVLRSNLKDFAAFFRYLPYTHFIFDTPESTSDYLEQFGLNKRNPSANDLTPDDIKLID